MEILFSNIKPHLRFVRYMNVNTTTDYPPYIPYDARLFYTLEGSGTIRVGRKNYNMKRGALLLINSGVEYHVKPSESGEKYLAINFDYTFSRYAEKRYLLPAKVSEFDPSRVSEHVTFIDAPEFNEAFYLENITAIEQKLISMEREFATKVAMYELKLSAALADILVRCYRSKASHGSFSKNKEVADKIVSFIVENYKNNISNQTIAKQFHYHPNYISDLIKRYTGFTLHQYLKQIRTTKAATMLLETDKSIADIATLCGFYDASHFIRCFKDVNGKTPQQYRDDYNSWG